MDNLSGVRDRSEALQVELKAALSRLATAETECRRLRSELEHWRKAAGDEEAKAMSAQARVRDAERRHNDSLQDLQAAQSQCDILSVKLKSCEETVTTVTEENKRTKAALQLRDQAIQHERTKAQELQYKLQAMEHAIPEFNQSILKKDDELTKQKVCRQH